MQALLLLSLLLLDPGPHAVGYRVDGAASIWYPALRGGETVRFRDYVDSTGGQLDELEKFLHSLMIEDATIVGLLDSRMAAHRDAPPQRRHFPVVLIFQGNGQGPSDQAVLAENIASQGFVVLTLPGPVVNAESEMGVKAQEQAEAFSRAIEKLVNVDSHNVSVVGHSFGARSMLLYAMHHSTRALISLDGGIGTANGIDELRHAAWFDASAQLPPILHLYETSPPMTPDHTFLKSLHTQSLLLEKVEAMQHAHFSTWGFAAASFPELEKKTRATDLTKTEVLRVAKRVVAFLKTRR